MDYVLLIHADVYLTANLSKESNKTEQLLVFVFSITVVFYL